MHHNQKIDYRGKDVYVGLDVHKKSYSVISRFLGEVDKTATVPANPEMLAKSLETWFPEANIHSVYEAGFSGFGLHRTLVKHGIDNIVVNPASVEVAANDKKKCDRRDANKLAEQRASGRLKGIYVPTIEEELRRQITRTRDQILKDRNRIACKIKSKLHYFGLIEPQDDRVMSKTFIGWIHSIEMPKQLRWSLDLLIAEWNLFSAQLKEIEVDLQMQAFEDAEVEEIYRSVPGIGPIGSRVLANELGDLAKRFKNQDALYQYTGLTPSEYSSGAHICKGHIDRQGSSRIRHILIQLAWRAIGKDPALAESFKNIAARRGKKIAIVAIARKLIGRVRACFINKQLYEIGLVS